MALFPSVILVMVVAPFFCQSVKMGFFSQHLNESKHSDQTLILEVPSPTSLLSFSHSKDNKTISKLFQSDYDRTKKRKTQ
jgi:hypothetical protein